MAGCRERRITLDAARAGVVVRDGVAYFKGWRLCAHRDCPCCGWSIAMDERAILQRYIDGCKEDGGQVWLVTLTMPHTRWDDLRDQLDRLMGAWRKMTMGRRWRGLVRGFGARFYRALEATHGENGWHCHFHLLLFVDGQAVRSGLGGLEGRMRLQAQLFELWAAACEKAGLQRPSFEHGVQVDDGEAAAGYVTKASQWGKAEELALTPAKRSRKGLTPFQLLERAHDRGDHKSAMLWRSWVFATEGIRRTAQSRSLSDLDREDDDKAAEPETGERHLPLTPGMLDKVARYRAHAKVLELAELVVSGEISDGDFYAYVSGLGFATGPPPTSERKTE